MTLLSNHSFVKTSANIATSLFLFFIGVQLLVAAGILPTSILWGGGQTELTQGLRLASIGATVILALFIYIIRYRAGFLGSLPQPTVIRVAAWAVTGYMALNTLGNFASGNSIEKLLFGPLTLVMACTCLIVSASRLSFD